MPRKIWAGAAVVVLAVVAAYLVSCAEEPGPPPLVEDELPVELDPEVEAFEKRRMAKENELAKTPVPGLAEAMATDSRASREPFNSAAGREVLRRAQVLIDDKRPVEPLAQELRATLKAPDASSHVALVTLFELSPDVYYTVDRELRYLVLTDALAKAGYLNAWGVPHLFLDQSAGKAIICEGPGIERYLYPVLEVDTKAKVFGNAEVLGDYGDYGYRVKDYGLALIRAVRGDTDFVIPKDPGERDKLIDQIRKQAASGSRVSQVTTTQMPDCPSRGDLAAQAAQTAE